MDFTLDDASTALQYSDGWDVQGSNDSLVAEFFESTYHATVTGGASVNLTFVGTGISLYGSKGPRHAQFTVYFDGVAEVLNARAPKTAFRQLLFQTTFANSTSSTAHLLSVVVQPLNNQTWFDLDYVSFSTADAGSAPPASSPTWGLTPPWASSTSTSNLMGSSASRPDPLYRSAVIALSTAVGILTLLLIAFGIHALHRRLSHAKEQSFRYGTTTTTSPPTSSVPESKSKIKPKPYRMPYPFTHRPGPSSSSTGLHQMEYRSGSQVDVEACVPRLAGRLFFARMAGVRDLGTGASGSGSGSGSRLDDDESSVAPYVQII